MHPNEVLYERRLWPRASSLIGKETLKKANTRLPSIMSWVNLIIVL